MSYVKDLEPIAIYQESVAELEGDATRIVDRRRSDAGDNSWLQGILEAYNCQPRIAQHIGINSGDGDAASAVELPLGIERQCALQEVIAWLSIQQGRDPWRFTPGRSIPHNDQPFILIRHIEEPV